MLEARKNNRVCPIPARWQELYQMLPERKNNQPTPPLVGRFMEGDPVHFQADVPARAPRMGRGQGQPGPR